MEIATARYLTLLYFIAALLDVLNGDAEVPELPISNAEIINLVNALREEDVYSMSKKQIILNYQKHVEKGVPSGPLEKRFFEWVDPIPLERETYRTLIALGDHYEPEVGIEEKTTPGKRAAIKSFIEAVLGTRVWKFLYEYLKMKGHPYAANTKTFRSMIYQLWFRGYSRTNNLANNVIDSSGFEHVFLGERKNDNVTGMHSWLRFYSLERDASQQFHYHGYIAGRYNLMAVVTFSWLNSFKPASSILIGVSPEFELALHTLCFLARSKSRTCMFKVDECSFIINSYDAVRNNKVSVAASHLFAGNITDSCRARNKPETNRKTTIFV